MGSFFIDEVAEDLRQDRLRHFWRRWRWAVFAGAAFLVLGVALNEGVSAWRSGQREAASLSYRSALEVSNSALESWQEARVAEQEESDSDAVDAGSGSTEEEAGADGAEAEISDEALRESLGIPALFFDESALADLKALSRESLTGVRILARLQLAWRHYESGRLDAARQAWRELARDEEAPFLYRDLASVLYGYAFLDLDSPASLREAVFSVAQDRDNAFWASASEVMALIHLSEGDALSARGYLEGLTSDASEVSGAMRRRANRLLAVLDGRAAVPEGVAVFVGAPPESVESAETGEEGAVAIEEAIVIEGIEIGGGVEEGTSP